MLEINSTIRGIIDFTLSSLLQVAENHNKLVDCMKGQIMQGLGDVLGKIR